MKFRDHPLNAIEEKFLERALDRMQVGKQDESIEDVEHKECTVDDDDGEQHVIDYR